MRGLLVSVLGLGLAWMPALADAQQMTKWAFSGGAVEATAAGVRLAATIGEAGVVGPSSTGGAQLNAGFWGSVQLVATSIGDHGLGPIAFENGLHQNAPNPFRLDTSIAFSVAQSSPTRIDVFDVAGRRVRTLVDEVRSPGRHQVSWDGRDGARRLVSNGVYFYRLQVGDWTDTRKMLRLK